MRWNGSQFLAPLWFPIPFSPSDSEVANWPRSRRKEWTCGSAIWEQDKSLRALEFHRAALFSQFSEGKYAKLVLYPCFEQKLPLRQSGQVLTNHANGTNFRLEKRKCNSTVNANFVLKPILPSLPVAFWLPSPILSPGFGFKRIPIRSMHPENSLKESARTQKAGTFAMWWYRPCDFLIQFWMDWWSEFNLLLCFLTKNTSFSF